MRAVRGIVPVLLCWAALPGMAQQSLQGKVIDARSGTPLPCGSVVFHRGGAAITNGEGVFMARKVAEADTLIVSYLGYRTRHLAVAAVRQQGTITLEPSTTELETVYVQGLSDTWYELLVRAGKGLRRLGRYEGKVYFQLGTQRDGRPVEAIEAFYNGHFLGSNIEQLDLKRGRIGLLPERGRFVSNLNTSRAFILRHPADANSAFPGTPLQFRSAKALREIFRLNLLGVGSDMQHLYRVAFSPRDSSGLFFHGEIWIDSAKAEIQQLVLNCENCLKHPFEPVREGDELRSFDLHYTQRYAPWKGKQQLRTIVMDYTLNYHESGTPDARNGSQDRRMHSTGVLQLNAPEEQFIVPLFGYDQGQTDYRKISAMPYDSVFWQEAPHMVPTEAQLRALELFATEGVVLGGEAASMQRSGAGQFFEERYAYWPPLERLQLAELVVEEPLIPLNTLTSASRSTQIRLRAQLFLSIDPTEAGYRTFSATVFDGYRSFCRLGDGPIDLMANIVLDLGEIERRKMQAALEQPGMTLERIRKAHEQAEADLQRATRRFLIDVDHGADLAKFANWNALVKDELGVDNFRFFGNPAEGR